MVRKRTGFFAPIDSREAALKAVKDYTYAFYFLAVMQVALGFFVSRASLIDGFVFAVLATFVRFWNSRVAAFLLIIVGSAAVIVTGMNKFGTPIAGMSGGGRNIVLAVLALWFAIKSFEATTKLHGVYSK